MEQSGAAGAVVAAARVVVKKEDPVLAHDDTTAAATAAAAAAAPAAAATTSATKRRSVARSTAIFCEARAQALQPDYASPFRSVRDAVQRLACYRTVASDSRILPADARPSDDTWTERSESLLDEAGKMLMRCVSARAEPTNLNAKLSELVRMRLDLDLEVTTGKAVRDAAIPVIRSRVQRLLAAPEDITDDAIDVILRAGKAACVTEASLTSVHSQLLAARRLAGSAAVSRMPATSSALQLGGASHGGGAAP